MADASSDIIKSEGTEVAQNPQGINFADGLDATNTAGLVEVGIKTSGVTTAKIADGAVTAAKLVGSQSVTATADGTGTGAITAPTSALTFVAVTSAAATNQIALPAITSASIGQVIYLTVGSNGYELITPASSGNTINNVDGDGTNQLDVAATTTVRATQVSASAWICETIAATSIAITAPDND
jgi:hypothetical protein